MIFYRFAHGSLLKKHIAVHHTNRNLKCKRCGKVFQLLADFKKHKLTHKGEKHLKCEWCSKAFGKLSHLTRHYKVHRNIKLIPQCSVCKATFKTKKELVAHSELHIDIQEGLDENENDIVSDTKCQDIKESEETNAKFEDDIFDESDVDEGGDFEVCTLCKKHVGGRSEFESHMQEHIDELGDISGDDDLDDDAMEMKLNKIISNAMSVASDATAIATDEGESSGSNSLEVVDNADHISNDVDDGASLVDDKTTVSSDVILTKITNDVTGMSKEFLENNILLQT